MFIYVLTMFIVHQGAIQSRGVKENGDQSPSREAMALDNTEESLALINDNFRAETLRSSLDHLNNEVMLHCCLKCLRGWSQNN